MTPEEANLEALKLAHRHDKEAGQVIETATAYRDFILGATPETAKAKRKTGTP